MEELSQKAKDARNEYLKEWRKKNKDKVKAYNRKYWEGQAEDQKSRYNSCIERKGSNQ